MTKDFFMRDNVNNGKDSILEVAVKNEGIPLAKFNDVENFLQSQNNYYGHFRSGMWGEMKREKEYYKMFKQNYPKLEKDLRIKVEQVKNLHEIEKEPIISDLFLAYNLMVDLINNNPSLINQLFTKEKRINIDPYILTR